MPTTVTTALVLQALAEGRHYGFDVMDATGLASGTVYPILRRLEAEGLVRARWEPHDRAVEAQRPPRRYYELTRAGDKALAEAAERYRVVEYSTPRRLKPGLT